MAHGGNWDIFSEQTVPSESQIGLYMQQIPETLSKRQLHRGKKTWGGVELEVFSSFLFEEISISPEIVKNSRIICRLQTM